MAKKPQFNIHQVLSWQFLEEQRRGATEFGQKMYDGPEGLYFLIVDAPNTENKRQFRVSNIRPKFKKGVLADLKSAGIKYDTADEDIGYIGYIGLSGNVGVLLDKSKRLDIILNKYATD